MKIGDLVKQVRPAPSHNLGVIVGIEMLQKYNSGSKQPYYRVMIGGDLVWFWGNHLEVVNAGG
jgi:hypothetical protein